VQGRDETKAMRLLIVDCASSVISPILGGTQGMHAISLDARFPDILSTYHEIADSLTFLKEI